MFGGASFTFSFQRQLSEASIIEESDGRRAYSIEINFFAKYDSWHHACVCTNSLMCDRPLFSFDCKRAK